MVTTNIIEYVNYGRSDRSPISFTINLYQENLHMHIYIMYLYIRVFFINRKYVKYNVKINERADTYTHKKSKDPLEDSSTSNKEISIRG